MKLLSEFNIADVSDCNCVPLQVVSGSTVIVGFSKTETAKLSHFAMVLGLLNGKLIYQEHFKFPGAITAMLEHQNGTVLVAYKK